MDELSLSFAQEALKRAFNDWEKIIRRKENALIVYPPRMDRHYQVPRFIHIYHAQYSLIQVNLESTRIEDGVEWNEWVAKNGYLNKNHNCVFLILDAECLFSERRHLLGSFVEFYHKYHTPFLLFSEKYPYTAIPAAFMQNLFWYPLYQKSDIFSFVSYLEKKFGVKLTSDIKQKIWQECGGLPWFVKQVVRFIAAKREGDPFDHEELWWKVKEFFYSFDPLEQKILEEVAVGKQVNASPQLTCLQKTAVVDSRGEITLSLVSKYLKKNYR